MLIHVPSRLRNSGVCACKLPHAQLLGYLIKRAITRTPDRAYAAQQDVISSIERETSVIAGTVARVPTAVFAMPAVSQLRNQLQTIVADLKQASPRTGKDDIHQLVDSAIHSNHLGLAIEALQVASSVELDKHVALGSLFPNEALSKVLSLAAYSQNVELGDKLISLALQSPSSRVDARVVEMYASLIGDAEPTEPQRAVAFCNLMLELGFNAFAPYLAALKRSHGEEAVESALQAFGKEGCSFEALRCIQTTLVNLGSQHMDILFSHMLAQALELQAAGSAPDVHGKSVVEQTYELAISGHLQLDNIERAITLLKEGWQQHKIPLTYSTFLVAKKLVSVLSIERPYEFGLIDSSLQSSDVNMSSQSNASVDVSVSQRAVDVSVSPLSATRLEDLIMCLRSLIDQKALRPRLLFNSMMVLRTFGHVSSNLQLVHRMLDDPDMRPNVMASRHVNPLLVDLIKRERIEDAENLFERIAELDPRYRHTKPNVKTYNILIHHAAKQGDKDLVRELTERMSEAGLKPDASTLAAIPMLRTSKLGTSDSADRSEEDDTDELLHKSVSAAENSAQSLHAGRNTFNQIMQSYFRLHKPAKALRVLSAMSSVRARPGQDTFRTVLYGITLSGGVDVTGTTDSAIPITWGGKLSVKDYDSQRKQATVRRVRVAAGCVAGHAPSDVLDVEAARVLRLYRVGKLLADIRAAVYLSHKASSGKTPGIHIDESVAKRCGLDWLHSVSGKNLLNAIEAFQPWPRTNKPMPVSNAAPTQNADQLQLDDSLDDSNVAADDIAELSVVKQDRHDEDLLPHFPDILQLLRNLGMQTRDLDRQGDLALSWSATFLSPRRSLQLFLTLYNAYLWQEKLTVGTRAMNLVPGLVTVDLRRVHVASACVFFHMFTSHLALQHLRRRPMPFENKDVAFLVGLRPGRLHAQIQELAKLDVSPHMELLSSERAFVWRHADRMKWLQAEENRCNAYH